MQIFRNKRSFKKCRKSQDRTSFKEVLYPVLMEDSMEK